MDTPPFPKPGMSQLDLRQYKVKRISGLETKSRRGHRGSIRDLVARVAWPVLHSD